MYWVKTTVTSNDIIAVNGRILTRAAIPKKVLKLFLDDNLAPILPLNMTDIFCGEIFNRILIENEEDKTKKKFVRKEHRAIIKNANETTKKVAREDSGSGIFIEKNLTNSTKCVKLIMIRQN